MFAILLSNSDDNPGASVGMVTQPDNITIKKSPETRSFLNIDLSSSFPPIPLRHPHFFCLALEFVN